MAQEQQSAPPSLKDRIAALNIEQVHAPAPGTRPSYSYEQVAARKKPPPPPPSSHRPLRQQSTNNPPVLSNAPTSVRQTGNQPVDATPETPRISPVLPPRLPPRTNSKPLTASPALPPRPPPRIQSSECNIRRRESAESISTINSGISSLSIGSAKTGGNNGQLFQVRAPAYDPSKLPPLPPKKALEDPKTSRAHTLKAMRSTSNMKIERTLPPQLPTRPPLPSRQESKPHEKVEKGRPRALPPPRPSALELGMNKATETPPPVPTSRPSRSPVPSAVVPPPIPLASRPNLNAIMASKPQPGAVVSCLKCRDFSAPDKHAARFPRQGLPSSDVGWLASQLTSPFPSATDKARAIYTWLHHNVEYDVHSFFGGTVSGSTPERTITTGLAVCEGYASLFSAIALKAGLESVVIGGHGKGYGHKALEPGEPVPPFKCGHAWNAVRIDNGEWKLLDACWGAGNVKGPQEGYQKDFKAYWFTMDNNEFGCKHFPEDSRYFFRTDGRVMTWEEYQMDDMGERLTVYGGATPDHGIGERSFQPALKHVKVNDPHNGPMARFQFAAVCSHWDNERHGKGKPYVMVLHVGGRDGRKTEWLPFNTDGRVWWLDVNRIELGAPGQKVSVFAVTSVDGKDGRGLSCVDYKSKKGKVGMGFGGVAMWELV